MDRAKTTGSSSLSANPVEYPEKSGLGSGFVNASEKATATTTAACPRRALARERRGEKASEEEGLTTTRTRERRGAGWTDAAGIDRRSGGELGQPRRGKNGRRRRGAASGLDSLSVGEQHVEADLLPHAAVIGVG